MLGDETVEVDAMIVSRGCVGGSPFRPLLLLLFSVVFTSGSGYTGAGRWSGGVEGADGGTDGG